MRFRERESVGSQCSEYSAMEMSLLVRVIIWCRSAETLETREQKKERRLE